LLLSRIGNYTNGDAGREGGASKGKIGGINLWAELPQLFSRLMRSYRSSNEGCGSIPSNW